MTTTERWTIGRLLDWTAKFLAEKGSEFPRLDTEVLLAHALGCKRIELYTRYTEEADDAIRARFKELIRKRIEGCPVAYLVGKKEFFSLELEVSPAVLIPRPESEFVVMECLKRAEGMTEPTILDIGTGSGNIAIGIAKRKADARVTAVDISPEALAVARRNIAKHGLSERITLSEGDLFSPVPGQRFDFIVSNPPYIPKQDIATLSAGVRDFEPHRALDGGPTGYEVLERLAAEAKEHLKPGGWLIVEIGAPQQAEAHQRIARHGFELQPTVFDYSRHPRVLVAKPQNRQSP